MLKLFNLSSLHMLLINLINYAALRSKTNILRHFILLHSRSSIRLRLFLRCDILFLSTEKSYIFWSEHHYTSPYLNAFWTWRRFDQKLIINFWNVHFRIKFLILQKIKSVQAIRDLHLEHPVPLENSFFMGQIIWWVQIFVERGRILLLIFGLLFFSVIFRLATEPLRNISHW